MTLLPVNLEIPSIQLRHTFFGVATSAHPKLLKILPPGANLKLSAEV